MAHFTLRGWAGVAAFRVLSAGSPGGEFKVPGHSPADFTNEDGAFNADKIRAVLPEEARPYVHGRSECGNGAFPHASCEAAVWVYHREAGVNGHLLLARAAATGSIPLFDYMLENGGLFSDGCFAFAARNDCGAMVRHVATVGVPYDPQHVCVTDALNTMARKGDLETVRCLLTNGCPMSAWLMLRAVESRSLPLIRYLCDRGCPMDEHATIHAAGHNNMPALQLLLERGGPVTGTAVTYAALNGHLAVVQYLIERGVTVTLETIAGAAVSGHLDVVQYLHESGAPISEHALRGAAKRGHARIVDYAIRHEFPGHTNPEYREYLVRPAAE